MASLVVAGDVSGSVTLSAPSAAGSVTITLPSSSGTMAVTGGSPSFATLTVTGDATISGLTVGKGGGATPYATAVGYQALNANTSGSGNSAFGYNALALMTTGSQSTALGNYALSVNTTGTENTGVGSAALYSNTTGNYNTSVGRGSLQNNTTAPYNTAVGYQAGYSGTTHTESVYIGAVAGYSVTTNKWNTFVGSSSGYLTTGGFNTFIGQGAGYNITTGTKNTILGQYSGNQGGLDIRTLSNYIVLSDGDGNPRLWSDNVGRVVINTSGVLDVSRLTLQMSSGDNAMSIRSYDSSSNVMMMQFYTAGNTRIGFIQTIGGASTTYSTSSDYRLKENIAPMTGALEKVAQLKPVTYTWKSNGKNSQGFIAHELAEIVPDCVTGEKDAVDENGNPVYQGIDTSFLVATLTAAIQELNAKVEAQAAEIAALKGAN